MECRAGGGIFGIRKTGAEACAFFYNHLVTVVDEFGHRGRHQPNTIFVVFDFLEIRSGMLRISLCARRPILGHRPRNGPLGGSRLKHDLTCRRSFVSLAA